MSDQDEEKLHWYCFSYTGETLSSGESADASTYTGYQEKDLISIPMIMDNKRNAGLTDKAVLIGVSYLGCMTKSEFKGK